MKILFFKRFIYSFIKNWFLMEGTTLTLTENDIRFFKEKAGSPDFSSGTITDPWKVLDLLLDGSISEEIIGKPKSKKISEEEALSRIAKTLSPGENPLLAGFNSESPSILLVEQPGLDGIVSQSKVIRKGLSIDLYMMAIATRAIDTDVLNFKFNGKFIDKRAYVLYIASILSRFAKQMDFGSLPITSEIGIKDMSAGYVTDVFSHAKYWLEKGFAKQSAEAFQHAGESAMFQSGVLRKFVDYRVAYKKGHMKVEDYVQIGKEAFKATFWLGGIRETGILGLTEVFQSTRANLERAAEEYFNLGSGDSEFKMTPLRVISNGVIYATDGNQSNPILDRRPQPEKRAYYPVPAHATLMQAVSRVYFNLSKALQFAGSYIFKKS